MTKKREGGIIKKNEVEMGKEKYPGPGNSNVFSKLVGVFNQLHGYLNQHKTLTQLSSLCKT